MSCKCISGLTSDTCHICGAATAIDAKGTVSEITRAVSSMDKSPWLFAVEYDAKTGIPLFALSHYDCLNALKRKLEEMEARLVAKGI